MRARTLRRSLALAGTLLAALTPVAGAQTAGQRAALKVFQDYVIDGRIDPCRHSSQELKLALDNVPPDIEQYAADYPSAIEGAIEARARGDCAGKKPATGLLPRPGTPTPTPSATATPEPTPVPTAIPTKTVVPEPPAPEVAVPVPTATQTPAAAEAALERVATARPANDAPTPVLLLGILAALLALSALMGLAIRRMERFAGVRHTWRELTWRAGGTWGDFRDWLRIGR